MDRNFLYNIGRSCLNLTNHLDGKVWLIIRKLGIGRPLPTKRGTRAGCRYRTLSNIATAHAHQPSPPEHSLKLSNKTLTASPSAPTDEATEPDTTFNHYMSITQIDAVTDIFERLPARQSFNQTRPKINTRPLPGSRRCNVTVISSRQRLKDKLGVGHHNCQPVGSKSKRTKIVKFVKDECIDVLFLTETWLRSTGDDAKCADLTPPGYDMKSFPRPTRGGGLAVLYRSHLPATLTSNFPFQHTSFELVQFTLNTGHSFHIFCLYRPPPSKKNKLLDSTFLSELPDLLDYCNLLRGKSMIVGDLNVHYDVPTDLLTCKVLEILTRFSLVQGVKHPTYYRSGHIIDWVVYREDDKLVDRCTVNHLLSSDHATVIITLNAVPPRDPPVYRSMRDLNSIDRLELKAEIKTLLQNLGTELSAQKLDDGLRALLNKHAPAMERRVPTGRSSPWYASVSDQLRHAKRQRGRAERRWKKTRSTVDRQIFWAAKETVAEIVQKAKEDYWSSKVDSCTSTKALFSVSNRLLGNCKNSILPAFVAPEQLPDAFADFFTTKVKTIREGLDRETPTPSSPFSKDVGQTKSFFDSFRPVTEGEVRRVITSSAPKSCALDPLPVPLLVECLDVLLPALTSIINSSLLTGIFPSIFKQSIVRPLLKKPSLDPNIRTTAPSATSLFSLKSQKNSFLSSSLTIFTLTISILPLSLPIAKDIAQKQRLSVS